MSIAKYRADSLVFYGQALRGRLRGVGLKQSFHRDLGGLNGLEPSDCPGIFRRKGWCSETVDGRILYCPAWECDVCGLGLWSYSDTDNGDESFEPDGKTEDEDEDLDIDTLFIGRWAFSCQSSCELLRWVAGYPRRCLKKQKFMSF